MQAYGVLHSIRAIAGVADRPRLDRKPAMTPFSGFRVDSARCLQVGNRAFPFWYQKELIMRRDSAEIGKLSHDTGCSTGLVPVVPEKTKSGKTGRRVFRHTFGASLGRPRGWRTRFMGY